MKEIIKALNKPYGLTIAELKEKTMMNEKTIENALNKLIKDGVVKKTKSKTITFFRVAVIFLLLSSFALAQKSESTTYNLDSIIDSSGGAAASVTYDLISSIGKSSGNSASFSYDLCAGFICNFYEFIINPKVTFLLGLPDSETTYDAYVDDQQGIGKYFPNALVNYYSCANDPTQQGNPTFGVVFAGHSLNYINVSKDNSYVMRVSQDFPGNKFILPVTGGGCTIIAPRMPQLARFGTLVQPFGPVIDPSDALELSITYPYIDIVGSLEKTGNFKLVIEKNETNEGQLIIKPA